MTPVLNELELVRARWRRARKAIDLGDPRSESFGQEDLAAHVEDVGVRSSQVVRGGQGLGSRVQNVTSELRGPVREDVQ